MMNRRSILKTGLACAGASLVSPISFGETVSGINAREVPSYLKGYETVYAKNPRQAALDYFRNAKFGLFMHYGLYSLLEGFSQGEHAKPAEWVQLRGKIRIKAYEKLATRFTAEKFDADFITDMALDAGMNLRIPSSLISQLGR